MEGLLDAASDTVRSILERSLATGFAQAECTKLARSCLRLSLVLAQIQTVLVTEESLRGECLGGRRTKG